MLPSQETELSGIYVVQAPAKKSACMNEARMLIGEKKLCISRLPLVAARELTYATEIQYDPKVQMHYIDIGITPAGANVLLQTVRSLPDAKFALALENKVICTFIPSPATMVRSFRIGNDLTLRDLNTIHELLKDVKF